MPRLSGDEPGPRTNASTSPVLGADDDIGLGVAAVDRDVVPHRAHARCVGAGGDQLVGERVGEVVLADQRVGEQRPVDPVPATAQRGVEREFLVRADVRRSARTCVGPTGPVAIGAAPVGVDRAGRLDHRVVGQERQRAVVAHVHRVRPRRRRSNSEETSPIAASE